MNHSITHRTTYHYHEPVSVSHHLLRLKPRALPLQRCIQCNLQVDPTPVVFRPYEDYFGNRVAFVTVEGAHRELVVTARSLVEITAPKLPDPARTPAWEVLRKSNFGDRADGALESSEFIYSSPMIRTQADYNAYARDCFPAGGPLLECALDLIHKIQTDFKFDPRATTVATPLEEVFRTRRGVCQDFAHFTIACLRSLGLPARYVSGYLETVPPPGKPRLVGADASHAWISLFCSGYGWIDLDPTNDLIPSTRHITVAWGRDYGDVCPVRGVILGSGEHTLKVSVDVMPVD